MKYWQDPQHFNVEVGNMMLAGMFGAPAKGDEIIGRRVLPGSQEAARDRFEAGRRAFITAHPWFYPGLRKLVPE